MVSTAGFEPALSTPSESCLYRLGYVNPWHPRLDSNQQLPRCYAWVIPTHEERGGQTGWLPLYARSDAPISRRQAAKSLACFKLQSTKLNRVRRGC